MTNDKVPQRDPGQWRIQELSLGVAHGERVEREPITGGLGAEPPAGSRGRAPGRGIRGAKPPEAESL